MRGCAPALLALTASLAAQQQVDFERDIEPLLADRCFQCHGPDAGKRKAGLRLDQRAGLFGERQDPPRTIVVPGAPERSELFRRISSDDPDVHMPPPSAKLPRLDAAQIALVRRWIAAGAVWNGHWSLQPPPAVVAVPPTGDSAWPRNTIDAFVLARLRDAGLSPSNEAPPAQLLRRVTFDLTGLPPTLDELDAFLADPAAGAYERAVERLLASPYYGERLASDWLDVARYADTHGYQADRYRAVWWWRDWVVGAFNDNLPYDRFLTWQLAGDLLPDATREQRLATAFNRLHRQTEEGGSIEEEFRVEYVADRVETFGTGMLGLTVGCARCHDHKYDPITQREFYQLFAFFQNIDESGQTSHFTNAVPVPALLLADAEAQAELDGLDAHVRQAEAELERAAAESDARFRAWLATSPRFAAIPGLRAALPLDRIDDGDKLANSIDAGHPGRAVDAPLPVPGHRDGALRLSGENAVTIAGVGDFTRSDAFSFGLWVKLPGPIDRAVLVHKSKAALDAASRGYQLLIEDQRATLTLAHMWPGNAIKIAARRALPTDRWVHLLATYDGSSRAAGLALYVDGERAVCEIVRDKLTKDITYGGAVDLAIGQRFRDRGFKNGEVDDLTVFDRCLTALEARELVAPGTIAALLADPTRRAAEATALRALYLAAVDPECAGRRAVLQQMRDAQRRAIERVPEIMTMQEMAEPRPAFVLARGAYDERRERVQADTPACLPPLGERRHDRLGLARWLTAPDHPLTARVAVNRYWQLLFGRGLVETADDFGSQGARPTHPQLLDWLAREFVASDWDVKALVRLIVTSATYRQDSVADPAALQRDPDNELLSRAPRYRWPAEMIRDGALAASGLLVDRLGGPPVKPWEPPGLWEEKSAGSYQPDRGEGAHRRSLYTFWKRTSPPPAMITFDMPSREHCTVRRQRTSTPLQALVLWNDPQNVECARALAMRAFAHGDLAARLRFVFRSLTSRAPEPDEASVLQAMYDEQLAEFAADPARAPQWLAVGETPADPTLPPNELAALSVVASALLGHDETLMKR